MSFRFLRSDLPVAEDPSSRFLPWLVSIMVFLAAMAVAGALAMDVMLERWQADMTGTLTVQIPPSPAAPETAERVERAVRMLRSMADVESAEAVSDDRLTALLEPWLGSSDLIAELPTPRLIDVELRAGASLDLGLLVQRLREVAPGAAVDDHRIWLSKLIQLAEGLRLLAWATLGLVAAATTFTVFHATRTALAVHRPQVEVLHLIGATDAYVARQFARRALFHGMVGGIAGLALAAPALWGIGNLVEHLQGGLIPAVGLDLRAWLVLGTLPVIAGSIAMVTARRTVRRQLARML